MFSKIEALDPSKHQDLRFAKSPDFSFAQNLNMAKVSFSEMRQAALYYPVIFQEADTALPTILLSIEADKNNYLDENKKWKVPYVPMVLRCYPFTFARVENDPEKMVLCIDRDAPHFASGQGDPLFTADGKLTEFVTGVMKSLEKYQQELKVTEAMFKRLADNDVIVPKKFQFSLGGQVRSIEGFRGVDMEKLAALEDSVLANLVRTGTLSMVHEHVHSLNNFPLVIAKPAVSAES